MILFRCWTRRRIVTSRRVGFLLIPQVLLTMKTSFPALRSLSQGNPCYLHDACISPKGLLELSSFGCKTSCVVKKTCVFQYPWAKLSGLPRICDDQLKLFEIFPSSFFPCFQTVKFIFFLQLQDKRQTSRKINIRWKECFARSYFPREKQIRTIVTICI